METRHDMIQLLESCFAKAEPSLFLQKYDALFEGRKTGYLNYFGINFSGGKIVSVKFYAHVTDRELIPERVQYFIPHLSDFNSFLPLRKKAPDFERANIGTALELKFRPEADEFVEGFFFNLNVDGQTFDVVGFPESLPESFKKSCIAIGANFEYGKETLRKLYYYFDRPETNAYFSERFGLPFLREARLTEYAESDEFSKIIATFGAKAQAVRAENTVFSEGENMLIDFLCEKYGLVNLAYGFYENRDVRSVYFFDADSRMNPNYPDRETYYVNTLQKLLKQPAGSS